MTNNGVIIALLTEHMSIFLTMSEKMKKPDDFTLELIVLCLNGDNLTLQRITPASSDELKELQELDEEGLTKFLVVDTSASFIAPKCLLQKLINDFSNDSSVFSKIVDRSSDGHNLVEIHASNVWIRKTALTPAQYQQLVYEENLILKNYKEPRLK